MGSLLVSMRALSSMVTGLPVTTIRLSKVALTMTADPTTGVCCAIFYDPGDGPRLGRLLASQFLSSFLQFATRRGLALSSLTFSDLSVFTGFQAALLPAIRESVRPVLDGLALRQRAVRLAVLVGPEGRVRHSTGQIDTLGLLSNLHPLLSTATDVMALIDDHSEHVWLDLGPSFVSPLWTGNEGGIVDRTDDGEDSRHAIGKGERGEEDEGEDDDEEEEEEEEGTEGDRGEKERVTDGRNGIGGGGGFRSPRSLPPSPPPPPSSFSPSLMSSHRPPPIVSGHDVRILVWHLKETRHTLVVQCELGSGGRGWDKRRGGRARGLTSTGRKGKREREREREREWEREEREKATRQRQRQLQLENSLQNSLALLRKVLLLQASLASARE